MKLQKRIVGMLLSAVSVITVAACGGNERTPVPTGTDSSDKVTILCSAAVGQPTDNNDPYKKYVKDNYGLDVTLVAASDFSTTSQLKFSNTEDMPDIVAFEDIDSFRTIYNQGVLLSDWTPYLKDMPNFSTIINTPDADRPGEDSIAKLMLTENDGLTALWTLPDPPSWSLKIREDWADEYRAAPAYNLNGAEYYPAGATATNGGAWQPSSPEDLLNFARWIKINKNADQKNLTCFGFSTAGYQTDFGVLGTWVPLMYGAVCQLPWGVYFDESGKVDFGITDGTEKQMLDFIRTVIKEQLIEPNWYYQNASQKTSTQGKIGIEWYTGEISETTQAYYNRIASAAGTSPVDTTDWWKTYPVPKEPGSVYGGFQASDGFLGTIITVSVKAANDDAKMEKIVKFLDDLAMTKTVNGKGETVYNRSDGYDALRWGIGIEDSLRFQTIEGTNRVYLYTGDEGVLERSYRSRFPGAWDWGMFFRSKDDGVVQGTSNQTVTKITNKVIEHDATTANYTRRLQYGSVLKLDSSTISTLTKKMQAFEYEYVNSTWNDEVSLQKYNDFVADWKKSGGDKLLADAATQFRRYGWIA
ncbi:MAG: hypothetical protein IJ706_03165 [Clostridia bacterium]|nr:hypothetical protein [Clostridia bacterium]